MQSRMKLSREQVFFLIFINALGNLIYIRNWADQYTGRAEWLSQVLAITISVPLAMWIIHLGSLYPDGTVFDIVEEGMGKFVSSSIIFIYILINIGISCTHVVMFTELLHTFLLEYTPSMVLLFILVLTGMAIASSGVKILGWTLEMLSLVGLLNFNIVFMIASATKFHIEYVVPIFDKTPLGVIKGSLFVLGNASEGLLLLFVLVSFIPEPKKHYGWVISGMVFSQGIFAIATLIITGILSIEIAARIAYGGVNVARIVQVGDYIRGLEIFILCTYQFIAIGKVSTCLYCIWWCGKKLFNNYKPGFQLVIYALIIFMTALKIGTYNNAYFLAVFLCNNVLLPFSVIVMLIGTISIILIKRKKGSSKK